MAETIKEAIGLSGNCKKLPDTETSHREDG